MNVKPTHKDGFGDIKHDLLSNCIKQWRGFEKKKVYAWVKSSGTIVSLIGDDCAALELLKDDMQKIANEEQHYVRLIELRYNETKVRLNPVLDRDEEEKDYILRGGHAIGGSPIIETPKDIVNEFKRIFYKQYLIPTNKDIIFSIDNNTAYAELNNVRCWVTRSDDLDTDVESGLKKKWSAYVSMIKRWNCEYHNIHIGDYWSAHDAVKEAFLGFVSYQIEEQFVDDFT